MEQNKEMLERFRAMLGAVDDGLSAARDRRLGRNAPAATPTPPPPAPGSIAETTGRPRFKAVRVQPRPDDTSAS